MRLIEILTNSAGRLFPLEMFHHRRAGILHFFRHVRNTIQNQFFEKFSHYVRFPKEINKLLLFLNRKEENRSTDIFIFSLTRRRLERCVIHLKGGVMNCEGKLTNRNAVGIVDVFERAWSVVDRGGGGV